MSPPGNNAGETACATKGKITLLANAQLHAALPPRHSRRRRALTQRCTFCIMRNGHHGDPGRECPISEHIGCEKYINMNDFKSNALRVLSGPAKLWPRTRSLTGFFGIILFAAVPFSLSAQQFDTSGDATIDGQYYVREILLDSNSQTGAITFAQSLTGIMTFNGVGGYSFSGQEMDTKTGTPQAYTKTSGYAVSGSGLIVLQDPLLTTNCSDSAAACVWGGVGAFGPNAIVANKSSGSINGIFVAIPIGVNVSAAILNGSYRAGFLDFLGGSAAQVRDGYFTLTSNNDGTISDAIATGAIANQNNAAATQTLTGVTYSFGNGAGTLTFPTASTPSSVLLSGPKTFYVSSDDNLLLGGATDGYDIFVAVRSPSGSVSSSLFDGTYFTTALEDLRGEAPADRTDSYFGSIRASGAATSLAHSRVVFYSGAAFDYTFDAYLPFGSDGTIQDSTGVEHMLGANGQAILSVGAKATYSLLLALQANPQPGFGVYIDRLQVFNAGNNAPITNPVAPGEYVALQGQNLANMTTQPLAAPFPTNLAGTTVTVNGRPAALSYVSAGQINVQVPYETSEGYATFQVDNNGTMSNTVTLYTSPTAPGVFTLDLLYGIYGDGSAAVQHSDFSTVTQSSPAQAGETLLLYLTGLGATSPAVSDGDPSPGTQLVYATNDVFASIIDAAGNYQPATVTFKGLTPNAVGLYQINFVVPSGLASGVAYVVVDTDYASTTEAKIYLGRPNPKTHNEIEPQRQPAHFFPYRRPHSGRNKAQEPPKPHAVAADYFNHDSPPDD